MKTAKVSGLEINVPDGSPFTVETPHMLPKLHTNMLVVAPRGHGKTCLTVNLVERPGRHTATLSNVSAV